MDGLGELYYFGSMRDQTDRLKSVRLTPREIHDLTAALSEGLAKAVAGAWSARVWLFGSRTDPTKKGGDIDLFVDIDATLEETSSWRRLMVGKIHEKLGERKIDLVIRTPSSAPSALYDLILQDGVLLCHLNPPLK